MYKEQEIRSLHQLDNVLRKPLETRAGEEHQSAVFSSWERLSGPRVRLRRVISDILARLARLSAVFQGPKSALLAEIVIL